MTDLHGRCAVVTGGNSGIGLALAVGLARAGADVAVWARNTERSRTAVQELKSNGVEALAVACDVGEEQSVLDATAQTVQALGKIDILFANAGIADAKDYLDTSLQ